MKQKFVLGNPGSLDSPQGSEPWSTAVSIKIHSLFQDTKTSVKHLEKWLKIFKAHEGWKTLRDKEDNLFQSFEAFCAAIPPFGLGCSIQEFQATIAKRKSLEEKAKEAEAIAPRAIGKGKPGSGRGNKTADNVSRFSYGNSKDYLLARIKRDRPDLIPEIGENKLYKSANSAAKAAGISTAQRQIYVSTPEKTALKLLGLMPPEDISSLIDALLRGVTATSQ